MSDQPEKSRLARSYERDSAEFMRFLGFTDAIYAIAATLLVITIAVPNLVDGDSVNELADALGDRYTQFISFLIGFAVIARYWAAHHSFVSLLSRIDNGLIGVNLIYLIFIAFLPFPTALLGEHFQNPLAIAVFAASVAAISGMEVWLSSYAYRHDLMTRKLPPDVYRWSSLMSLSPVIFFALSIPIAFVTTELAIMAWFLSIPFQIVANRWKPPETDEYFG